MHLELFECLVDWIPILSVASLEIDVVGAFVFETTDELVRGFVEDHPHGNLLLLCVENVIQSDAVQGVKLGSVQEVVMEETLVCGCVVYQMAIL